MEKIKIQKNTVMETLVLPLYGRAYCSENYVKKQNLFLSLQEKWLEWA